MAPTYFEIRRHDDSPRDLARVIEDRVLLRQETTRGAHLDEPPFVLDQRHRCLVGGVVGRGILRTSGPHFGDAVEGRAKPAATTCAFHSGAMVWL